VQEIPSKANVQTPPPGKSTARTHAQNPGKIWESKIFK
jgi:hypothetical protein